MTDLTPTTWIVFSLLLLQQIQEKPRKSPIPADVGKRITQQLAKEEETAIVIFDKQGKVIGHWSMGTSIPSDYATLKDYVSHTAAEAMSGNPISSCKDPVASPPCVICADGRIICTKATFHKSTDTTAVIH